MFVHLSPLFDTGLDCRCSLLNSQSDQAARSSAVSGDSPTITGKPFNAALPDKRSSDRSSVRSLMLIPGCARAMRCCVPGLAWPQPFGRDTTPRMMSWVACTSTRSEEHTSELQSLMRISYAVFCLKKKNTHKVKQQ